ncbi:SIR2 family protein [Bradyrhizobium sp. 200]|uniref:SIR2 family protein n=1 Tax=Bradyrhizobium sp. 200 TaxID=2782665 RepID=UPI001FFFA876|nr:SIR2 family protein [Bradyrhizobium sp. 200]UPJ53378.1 SIR2 family protein [Bradyrhizobium sp. 200]
MADESVKRIARRYFAERIDGKSLPEHVKTSEWWAWLVDQPWFIPDPSRLAENFPLAVKHLLTPQAYRQRVLLDLIAPEGEIGIGYRHLSELVLRGLVGSILTTNFDICLPRALNDKRPHIRHVAEVHRSTDDFREFDIFNRAQIVWLHGKAEQYTDKNLTEEVQQLNSKLVGVLLPLLQSTPMIVVGYRGAEPSIMTSLLGEGGDLAFKKGVYWCHRGGDLHPNVEALRQRLGSNFRLCEIDGFDELFADLDKRLARQQRSLGAPAAVESRDFDDRPAEGATIADIDLDLALRTAHEYSRKLKLRQPSAATLKPFLRELGLLVDVDGSERPSVAAILLFGREPQRFLPHAIVTTTIDGKKRKVITGNLLQQRKELLEWAEQKEVNAVLKVKVRGLHEERRAYHERALIELLINLLVHRDYADVRPAEVHAQTNDCIVFLNPGRLSEVVADEVKMDARGQFEPVRELTSPRNRALCDVFFGMSVIERAGTGLSDVLNFAREGDGTAVFSVPPGSDDFRVELYQPKASGKVALVARDTRPIGTYIVNLMPFGSLPENVSRVKVSGTLETIARRVPLSEIGRALIWGGELWSFARAPLLEAVLKPVMMESNVRERPREEVEADPDLARMLSWLLRKHFESQLWHLKSRGLMIEADRRTNRRAYFFGENNGPRLLIYDTPARRNVEREVVKQRGDPPRVWFENEGFAYEIVRLGSLWGVRVKPFYMFTGPDARTPLPGYARTAKATRRMKYDRNQSVESDLTFWARFISQGTPVLNLGQGPVEDLLLEGAFISLDVPEEGLIDGDGDKDQMPA